MITPALGRVLSALEDHGLRVTGAGDRRQAQCPAHDDRNPSLSIGDGGGRVLLKCHAGCDTADVIAGLGLDWSDLFDEPRTAPRLPGRVVREHHYRDGADQLVGTVVRIDPKSFRPVTRNGAGWTLGGSDALKTTPYNFPKVVAAVHSGQPVYVVEGERDADTLARHDVTATCNQGGAGKWTADHAYWLKGAEVVVVRDADDAGERHARAVAATLADVAGSVRVLRPADGCKDVTEHVKAGHGLAELVPCPELVSATSDGTADLLAGLRNGVWLDAQEFSPLAYAVPGVIPEGSTLLVGPPKIGKSWFVLSCALSIAAGGSALGTIEVDLRRVFYLALEDGDRRLQDRCRTLLNGDPIPEGFEYLTTVMPGMVVPTITAWLERYGGSAPLVILDTLGKAMPPALPGESAYQRDYRIGSALKRLADDYPGTSLLTNHHDRKAGSDDFVDSVSGTHGLAGAADTVITLTRARHETTGLLKVTGRDVAEGEYALTFDSCGWRLDGSTLLDAASKAAKVRATAGVGGRMAEVIAFVAQRPAGVRAAEVARALQVDGDTVGRYLRRAAESGRVIKADRGLYTPVRSDRLSGSEGETTGHSDTSDTDHESLCAKCGAQPPGPGGVVCVGCAADIGSSVGARAVVNRSALEEFL